MSVSQWPLREIQALQPCTFVPLVCNACGNQTDRKTPSFEDLKAFLLVQALRTTRHELVLLQRTQVLCNRFPDSRHPVRVAILNIKLPSGSKGEPDQEFEAAMREDPELADWLCPSQGYRGIYLPARLKATTEAVNSLEKQVMNQPIARCSSCGQAALEVPESFIEEQLVALRNRQVAEAKRLKESGYPLWSALFFAEDLSSYVTDANDHDPVILMDCERCYGEGCAACEGTGIKLGSLPHPFFRNNADFIDANVDDQGWVTCPGCNQRFNVNNPRKWTGRRHWGKSICGQKLRLRNI